ncbi:MAG: MBL fold metallo-hydrolase [Gammaproteobacteria bacterium]|jgi:glyoxylase-like metal-dependent hydrolase (beta-lactamase superfamily II)/rhodanese-related sulfurtransferase
MKFETFANGGCKSYMIGCENSSIAAVIDPEVRLIDRYQAAAAQNGLRIHYVIDTHTHADHFSGADELSETLRIPVVMHPDSAAPFVAMRLQDGDMLRVGDLRVLAMHTPGHTRDSLCLLAEDRLFTGDTLLIGGTGRTDLPTGDPSALYDSLFNGILKLDPATRVFPAHDYKQLGSSTIAAELENNPRLQKTDRAEFIDMMEHLNLSMPTHLTEALRTNMTGGRSVAQLLAAAAEKTPFISLSELARRLEQAPGELIVLDVRQHSEFETGHIPGAMNVPRGQLELRVDDALPDPTARIVTVCEFGKISTLAAATLRELGFLRTAALDGGMRAWHEQGLPTTQQ